MAASAQPQRVYRLATAADVPALAALYAECARVRGPEVYAVDQVAAWASFGAPTPGFADYVLDARTWVLDGAGEGRAGGPIAFSGIGDSGGGEGGGGDADEAAGEVHSLYVHPAHARRGLGTSILRHALADDAARRGPRELHAWATPFSRPRFEAAGFVLVDVVRAEYQGAWFDRLRMRRSG
jgi:putative acetyltransferase